MEVEMIMIARGVVDTGVITTPDTVQLSEASRGKTESEVQQDSLLKQNAAEHEDENG